MKVCISGAPVDDDGVCTEHGETACVITWRGPSHYCRCHWCCQSTPPDRRGEAHQNCHKGTTYG